MFDLTRAILSFMHTKNTRPCALLVLSATLSMMISPGAEAQEAEAAEQTPTSTEEAIDEAKPEAKQKPWLITPTLSADPKLGANIGGLIAYVKKLDADSTPSMTGLSVSYSDTDSVTGALFSQLYWKADTRRLSLLAAGAKINNEYDDFLGTGQTVKTQDNVHSFAFRYMHQLRRAAGLAAFKASAQTMPSAQTAYSRACSIRSAYQVLTRLAWDGCFNTTRWITSAIRRRDIYSHCITSLTAKALEEASFDVGYADLRWYRTLERFSVGKSGRSPVIAVQVKGRFTADAPLSGYSSVNLPGYTMGNYLSRHYSHVLLDARIPLVGKLGLVAFGGVGCQFGEDIVGRDLSCSDETFPSIGVGVSYMLKAEASVLIRLEIAKGKSDNEALYLRFGHSF